MSNLYADRGFGSINGVEFIDVESITVKIDDGTKPVGTMSRDRRNKGFVKGNRNISFTLKVAVRNRLGSPKLEAIDYEANDVAFTAAFGDASDRYTLVGISMADTEESASGVGSEVSKSFSFHALDILDQVGNSVVFASPF